MWWAGGTWCEMRITTVCAVASEATERGLATAKTQPMRVYGFLGFPHADVDVKMPCGFAAGVAERNGPSGPLWLPHRNRNIA